MEITLAAHRALPGRVGLLLALACGAPVSPAAAQEGAGAPSSLAAAEAEYYRMITLPLPEGVVLEVGGLETLPDGRLAVATRRGEVWMVENPSMQDGARPHFTRYAHGLHEALGLAYRDGALYTAQRSELTRLRDETGDGRADLYETIYDWPLSGNYHEYSFGPLFTPTGEMIVTLNLAWIGFGESFVKWRGWMLEIDSVGGMTPIAAGFRSPSSFGTNLEGDLFYSENQGDWVGTGGITHVEPGDFVGNPRSLRWSDDPASPIDLAIEDIPDTNEPKFEVAKRVPGLKTPAVWFPHALMGISTSAILVDSTGGAFGPFAGQLFVGDQGHSKIMRVYLERVDGVYQGIVFPFREGFESGVFRQVWGTDGSMYVGMTSRGWGATGRAPYGLQRLVWTGKTPFEPHRVEARPDGFEITFTMPVNPATARDPASYGVTGFTYGYGQAYGSSVLDQVSHPVRGVVVSPDGQSARLAVDGLREGYIHEIRMSGVRSQSGAPLLHDVGYYTLNRIPTGPRLTLPSAPPAAPAPAAAVAAPAPTASPGAALAKRQLTMPVGWNGSVDQTVSIQGLEGLVFSLGAFEVKAGSRIRLDLGNVSDMLHNLLVVRPGTVDRVAQQALELGLDGTRLAYVPPTDDVLYHTGLVEPQQGETIYFEAPTAPGEYPFVCTFPGHAFTMRGVMRVVP